MSGKEGSPPLLSARGLVRGFRGRRVVDQVDLRVDAGEIVGLLGPNGAGKTTSFNLVVGLLRPERGEVVFQGRDVTRLPMHRRARLGIGYLTQEPSVFRKLTVAQNVMAILELTGLDARQRRSRLESLLEELDLSSLAGHRAYTLSGGEKRRLEITRALVTSPRLLMLDEPFGGVDPLAILEVQGILRRLRERGLGILITDHNVRETLSLVDRAYLIHRGRVVCQGSGRFLAGDPRAREIYLGPEFRL